MKKLLTLIILLLAAKVYADDTLELQAMIDAGNVKLPAHHAPYSITRLVLKHSLNANGNAFRCILPDGEGFIMKKRGIKLSNAEIYGGDDFTNPSGASGVQLNGDHDTVENVYIHKFSAYAIIGGNGNNSVVRNCKFADIGYSCMFLVTSTHPVKGGIVAGNTFDQSMMNPGTIPQPALMLRGSKINTSAGWKVYNNTFIMPFSPKELSAECFELRYAPYSEIHHNTCTGGTIGISVVRNDFVKTYSNKCYKQHEEGIEYADSNNGMIRDNIISDQEGLGVLIDGFAPLGCRFDTLLNNNISKCKGFGIQLYKDTYDTHIRNCNITTKNKAINIQGAHGVTIQDCTLSGSGYGSTAIFLDNSQGKVTMKGGSMNGFEHKLFIYANKQVKTDDVVIDGVRGNNNIKESDKSVSGGAVVGANIRIK